MCETGETTDEVSEPMNIVTVAVRYEGEPESHLREKFYNFCQERHEQLRDRRIRRITFLVLEKGKFPQYYTFR